MSESTDEPDATVSFDDEADRAWVDLVIKTLGTSEYIEVEYVSAGEVALYRRESEAQDDGE